MTELHLALMNRNGCTKEEADDQIMEMKERYKNGEDPEEVLYSEGLEPDYVFDILFD